MPGDVVFREYIESLSSPWFLFVIGILIIFAYIAIKAIPMIEKIRLKRIECDSENHRLSIEQEGRREQRKAEEFQQELQRDKERTEVIGKQNEILEHLARTHENQSTQIAAMLAALEESKARSREMGNTVKDTNTKVSEIHTIIMNAGTNK